MSCPVCQNATSNNNVYCSPICARRFLSAVREANPSHREANASMAPRHEVRRYDAPNVPQLMVPRSAGKQPYRELLKQKENSEASEAAKPAISKENSQENSQENPEADDGKCKKCKINPRNDGHPICTECYKAMKDKPEYENKAAYVKKDKSKYDKKKK